MVLDFAKEVIEDWKENKRKITRYMKEPQSETGIVILEFTNKIDIDWEELDNKIKRDCTGYTTY